VTLCLVGTPDPDDVEPTTAELALIEAERPVLEAELAVVAAECAYLASPSAWARARVRRAETHLAHLCAASCRPLPAPVTPREWTHSTTTDHATEGVA
jgi:hypothetical protein